MGDFFRIVRFAAKDAAENAGIAPRIRRGEIDAALIRDMYSPHDCTRIAERLLAGAPRMPRSEFPAPFRSWFHGVNLNLADPDLESYFAATPLFERGLAELFEGMAPLDDRVLSLLARIDCNRPHKAPPGPVAGQRFMFTTLRHHAPGGFIPPHFDNEQAERPSFASLLPLIRPDLLSFVLAFTVADAGGELEIFDLRPGYADTRVVETSDRDAEPDLSSLPSVKLRLQPGEMILFSSGRRLHRLTPVEGRTPRLTACSFLAESIAGDSVYCWG